MILDIFSEQNEPLHFMPGLPGGYKGKLLPGGHAFTCIEDFGTLIVQEIQSALYRLSFFHIELKKPTRFHWKVSEPASSSCFALKNDLIKIIPATYSKDSLLANKIKIRQGQVNFQSSEPPNGTLVYESASIYESIYTGYSAELLKGLRPPNGDKDATQWAGVNFLQWIDDIFTNNLNPALRQLYYETKVKEFLLVQIGRNRKKFTRQQSLLPHERAAVYETLEIINRDIKQHISIDEIAKRLGIKNFHLKKIFPKETGKNIYEYQLYRKMTEARRLLIETDLGEKEIADQLGYSSLSPFVTAFHRYFDIRPSELRHKNK